MKISLWKSRISISIHNLVLGIVLLAIALVPASAQSSGYSASMSDDIGGSKAALVASDTISTAANVSQVLDAKKPAATFEGGKLYRAGNLKVLELHGSYREMGRQYGALMKDDLNGIYDIMSADFGKTPGIDYDDLLDLGKWIYRSYPQRYKEILNGMAETSGLGLDKELIVCSMEYTYIPSTWKCSGVAAWDNYTSGGPLVFGRNYDYGPRFANYASLVVYNPDDGNIPVASVTYTGAVYVTTGMNKEGLFLELNNGQVSESMQLSNRVLSLATLFSFLESSADLEQIDIQFHTSYPDNAFIINVANKTRAASYEWGVSGVVCREPDKDGLLVSTNHFIDPSWGVGRPGDATDKWFSKERRKNLLKLAEANKGKINPTTMMQMMSIPLEDGGAFMDSINTSYQVVAVPGDLKVWIRIPDVQDWTEVDLRPLFS